MSKSLAKKLTCLLAALCAVCLAFGILFSWSGRPVSAGAEGGDENVLYSEDFSDALEGDLANSITASDGEGTVTSNAMFNLPIIQPRIGASLTETAASQSQNEASVYTIDPEGNIDFPVLGSLHVAGLRRDELSSMIKHRLESQNLLQKPVVTVEYMNLGYSVLGEVNNPGRFLIDKDHVTVLDALSMAGDLTIQGRRSNITVVRQEGNVQKFYPIDLTSAKSVYGSPAYYLRQNDMVYVQPNAARARLFRASGNTMLQPSFWISLASLLTTVVSLLVISAPAN